MLTRWFCFAVFLGASTAASAQDLPSGPLSLANGRVVIGTDLSISASTEHDDEEDPANAAWFNYTDYEHNTMRLVRLGVTTDIRVSDRVSFLGDVRSENGDGIRAYALYVRVRPWKNHPIDIQAGRVPTVFGAFSRRVYGNGNPLIGYPLAYQYLTALRADAIPVDAEELFRMRARGWRPTYRIGSQELGTGMPQITAFRWDTGAQVHVGSEQLMASVSLTNGTLSDPHTRDNNGSKQISGRAQWIPTPGLVLGASGAYGGYLADEVNDVLALTDVPKERAFGFDAEYSRDHWLVRSEGVWTNWNVPTIAPLTAGSVFVEGTYKILPGFYVAARGDTLRFSRVAGALQTRTWDAAIERLETGVGVYVRRNLLVRGTYQHNWRDGGFVRNRRQLNVQLQFWL